jgi:uncharacterized protein YjbJ (UPF0337 family)
MKGVNMNVMINQHIFAGRWKQVRGRVKQWWGKFTEDDLDYVNGYVHRLISKVQERYLYARDQAEKEVARFMAQLDM